MINLKKPFVVLGLVVICTVILRFVFMPPLSVNESRIGYRAYSLVKTGVDETGRPWPVVFSSFTEIELPVPTYLAVPGVALFGLNRFGVNSVLVILSALAVVPVWFIARKLLPDNPSAQTWFILLYILAPATLAVSQVGATVQLAYLLVLASVASAFVRASHRWYRVSSIVLFGLALQTDTAIWFLAPLFGVGITLYAILKKRPSLIRHCFPYLLCYVAVVGIVVAAASPAIMKRSIVDNNFGRVHDVTQTNAINKARGIALENNDTFGPLFYNKLYLGFTYVTDVARQYHPRIYFAQGDGNPLHGYANFGFFPVIVVPFFTYGLYWLLKNRRQLAFGLFAASLPITLYAALAYPTPDQQRLFGMFVPVGIVAAVGLSLACQRKTVRILVLLVMGYFSGIVLYDVVVKEPGRSIAFTDMTNLATYLTRANIAQYDAVYLTDQYVPDPAPLLLYKLHYDPRKLVAENGGKQELVYHTAIRHIGKLTIANTDEIVKANSTVKPGSNMGLITKNVLIFLTPEEARKLPCVEYLTNITEPNGRLLYQVVTLCQKPFKIQ